jgi:hypothetical protein
MQIEIDILNADGKLKPGMYVQASFEGQRVGTRWRVLPRARSCSTPRARG